MVNWNRFIPSDFEYDFDRDKLISHGVTFEEAVECFFRILRFVEIRHTKTVTNLLAIQWEGESLE